MNTYWKTISDGEESIHLSFNGDTAICGFDLAGDETIHDAPPKQVESREITCHFCVAIISAASEHIRLTTAYTRPANRAFSRKVTN